MWNMASERLVAHSLLGASLRIFFFSQKKKTETMGGCGLSNFFLQLCPRHRAFLTSIWAVPLRIH